MNVLMFKFVDIQIQLAKIGHVNNTEVPVKINKKIKRMFFKPWAIHL